jgi:wobble nucleotide-excising tRNase
LYKFFIFLEGDIVSNPILSKEIIGNKNSTLSDVVEKLQNIDWVKSGLKYIDQKNNDTQKCPFCQASTINSVFIENLNKLFDEAYENDITAIKSIQKNYSLLLNTVDDYDKKEDNPLYSPQLNLLKQKFIEFKLKYQNNFKSIDQKIEQPSKKVIVESLEANVIEINEIIKQINSIITVYNEKIANRQKSLEIISSEFWEIMRWTYSSIIESSIKNIASKDTQLELLSIENANIINQINVQKGNLIEEQSKTVNIKEAVDNINTGLLELGIDSFTIENHKGNFYRIVRPDKSDRTFITLSEGEKMIISFLYFIEMCHGKLSTNNTSTKKIIVIDDPISSLSHIYVFNISQLIKNCFTNPQSDCEQVFIMTHSLYFFYDLTFMKSEDREMYQNLYRIIKNEKGSLILPMKYTEVQNDYQSYWQVIKDPDQSPALIANCMRNIIEYFFAFVEKYELSCIFQKEPLKKTKYQAFNRYINRESHSLGQNIFDLKEFDYNAFKEAFRLVFYETGYEAHYKKMIK